MNADLLEEWQDVVASEAGGSLEAAADNENLIEDEGELLRSEDADSQQIYIESGNNKKVLFLLCIGLNDDNDVPVFMFENEPWSRLPKNSSMWPKNTDLVNEITRRGEAVQHISGASSKQLEKAPNHWVAGTKSSPRG